MPLAITRARHGHGCLLTGPSQCIGIPPRCWVRQWWTLVDTSGRLALQVAEPNSNSPNSDYARRVHDVNRRPGSSRADEGCDEAHSTLNRDQPPRETRKRAFGTAGAWHALDSAYATASHASANRAHEDRRSPPGQALDKHWTSSCLTGIVVSAILHVFAGHGPPMIKSMRGERGGIAPALNPVHDPLPELLGSPHGVAYGASAYTGTRRNFEQDLCTVCSRRPVEGMFVLCHSFCLTDRLPLWWPLEDAAIECKVSICVASIVTGVLYD
ncbi:hypothetical protein C8Q77DRAFT_257812 [Trametes polyzona]|nr:hypothetical protein C8Q77DRAFT_257812 [Trametes polyzona]